MNLHLRISSFLLLANTMLSSSAKSFDEKHEKAAYVQGGACDGGNGSKKHPFNSLA